MKAYKYIFALAAMVVLMPISFAKEIDYCKNLPELTNLENGEIKFKDTVFYFGYGDGKQPAVKKSEITAHGGPLVFLKAVKKGKVIYQENFDLFNSDAPTALVFVKCNSGLSNVELMITFYFTGESCGSPDTEYNYAWSGAKLFELPSTKSMPDADYTYSERLLLPSETGMPNVLMLLISKGEGFEEHSDKMIEDREIVLYEWDGQNATEVKQKQIRRRDFENNSAN